jgi:hypothetical protein
MSARAGVWAIITAAAWRDTSEDLFSSSFSHSMSTIYHLLLPLRFLSCPFGTMFYYRLA